MKDPNPPISARPELPIFDLAQQRAVPFDGRMLRPGALVADPNPMMGLLDAIGTRRTSRAYRADPVERDTFAWLVHHAAYAPTACNEQQWKVILIDDPDIIHDLYLRGSASFLKNVRQCFLLCYNRMSDNTEWDDHIQSGAAFITTFQLLAHSIGVGSCWIGHLPNKAELRRVFAIHRHYEPVALVSFGFYRSKTRSLPRKHDVDRLIMHNRFSADGLRFADPRRTTHRTLLRYLYYKLPAVARRQLKPYTARFEKKFYHEDHD